LYSPRPFFFEPKDGPSLQSFFPLVLPVSDCQCAFGHSFSLTLPLSPTMGRVQSDRSDRRISPPPPRVSRYSFLTLISSSALLVLFLPLFNGGTQPWNSYRFPSPGFMEGEPFPFSLISSPRSFFPFVKDFLLFFFFSRPPHSLYPDEIYFFSPT